MKRPLAVVIATGLLAGCFGGGDDDESASEPATDTGAEAPATTALELGPGQVLHHIGASFQYGAFLVTLGDAVYDENEQELLVGSRFRNLGGTWHQVGPQATLRVGSFETPLLVDRPADVPPGVAADLTMRFPSLERDPIEDGTITWGRDGTTQPVITLADGSVENGWLPARVDVGAWGRIGKHTVHVTGGQVQAGQLNLDVQAAVGERILRLDFDLYNARSAPVNGFFPNDHLTLVRPDGTTVEAVGNSDGVAPLSWTSVAGNWIEFPVSEDIEGDYSLLLSSVSPNGFSTLHPELIERVPLEFHLDAVEPGEAPEEPSPQPVLVDDEQPGEPIDVDLDVGAVNVPGFGFTPRHLSWDPAEQSAILTGDAYALDRDDSTAVDPTSAAGQAAGLLEVDPTFSFSELLVSGGNTYTGVTSGDATVPIGTVKRIAIEFLSVTKLDPDDAGLYIGNRGAVASSMPLGPASRVPLYPPDPRSEPIAAPPVTAGNWTVQLTGYRVGLIHSSYLVPPGKRLLEVVMDVTASPTAEVKALGLSFSPVKQLFLSQPDGYMVQAVGDSGLVSFNPGETHRAAAIFQVPDSFTAGTVGFVLRSGDEVADIFTESFVETTFAAELGTTPSSQAGGSL